MSLLKIAEYFYAIGQDYLSGGYGIHYLQSTEKEAILNLGFSIKQSDSERSYQVAANKAVIKNIRIDRSDHHAQGHDTEVFLSYGSYKLYPSKNINELDPTTRMDKDADLIDLRSFYHYPEVRVVDGTFKAIVLPCTPEAVIHYKMDPAPGIMLRNTPELRYVDKLRDAGMYFRLWHTGEQAVRHMTLKLLPTTVHIQLKKDTHTFIDYCKHHKVQYIFSDDFDAESPFQRNVLYLSEKGGYTIYANKSHWILNADTIEDDSFIVSRLIAKYV